NDNRDIYELSTDYNGELVVNFEEPFAQGNAILYYNGTSLSTVGTANLDSNNMITSITHPCAAAGGSYYLSLDASNCTTYSFNYTNTYYGDNNEQESNDSFENAQLLHEFDYIFGQVGYGYEYVDNLDYYQLNITESAPLTINLQLDNNMQATLYENYSSVATVLQTDSSGPIEKLDYNNVDTSKTYHLKILNTNGICSNYNISGWEQAFIANNDAEPNNNVGQATAINFNEFYNGRLSYYSSGNDSQDFYSFSINQDDSIEFILNAFEGLVNTVNLALYDSLGTQLFSLTHDGANTAKSSLNSKTSNSINLSSGDYYFIMSGTTETGSYQFKANSQNTLNTTDKETNETLNIYPNPTKNIVNIKLIEYNKADAFLYDLSGRLVLKQNLSNPISSIHLESLNSGMYVLEIKTENKLFTKRIIKQ
ncbi:T9SS type A sorting domain-containing protein, partial [Algibacter sp.]|uniref:T9SS type A sorting domain-containing protein n=1 Tax=Algibacter sp. TaxID=1872428 RepID=UPI003C70A37B